jgi:hypothetical protein
MSNRRYSVEIARTVVTTIEVDAENPEEAVSKVDKVSFPLPPADEWRALKGWEYTVLDDNGDELYHSP